MLAGMKLVSLLSFHLGTPLRLSEKIGTAKLRSFRTVAEAAKVSEAGKFLELKTIRLVLTNYELQGTQIVMNGIWSHPQGDRNMDTKMPTNPLQCKQPTTVDGSEIRLTTWDV